MAAMTCQMTLANPNPTMLGFKLRNILCITEISGSYSDESSRVLLHTPKISSQVTGALDEDS
jgi:hypothetical protein